VFNNEGFLSEKEFRTLYDTSFAMLVRISYRITSSEDAAEDLVHDAFIRLCEKNLPFPTLNDARYWLIRVVKNSSLNYAKRKGREKKAYEKHFREPKKEVETGLEHVLKDESLELVQKALDMLPPNLKEVLVLKEYGDMKYKEIGTVLGISEGNVKVRVFRARERLLELLKEASPYVP